MKILVYYLASKQNWIMCLFCCSECSIGFYGLYPICKECPFPSFGFMCQYLCDCNNDTCDHVTGCMDSMLFIGIISIYVWWNFTFLSRMINYIYYDDKNVFVSYIYASIVWKSRRTDPQVLSFNEK